VKNHCIRRIDERTGFITTVAGSGQMGYGGDGKRESRTCNEPYEVRFGEGHMYFVEMQNHVVRRVDAKTAHQHRRGRRHVGSRETAKAVKAKLKQPHSIALDGGGTVHRRHRQSPHPTGRSAVRAH
jgi:hypothetical protein